MSQQIIENTEMPMENVAESQVAQNDEQGLGMSQDTINNSSGREPIRGICDRCGDDCQGQVERAYETLLENGDPLAAHVDRIFSHYEATEIAPMPIAFGEGMEFETDLTNFVANIFDAFVDN